jgi:hypothetical protein
VPSDVLVAAAEGSVTVAAASVVDEDVVMRPLVDESTDEKLEGSNGEAIVAVELAGCVQWRSNLRDAAFKALWPRANEARVCIFLGVVITWLAWIPMHRDDWSIWEGR